MRNEPQHMDSTLTVRWMRLRAGAPPPGYAHPGDAGLDLRSAESRMLEPGQRHLFSTGVALEIPAGYVGLVWDRSSLGARGLTTFGGVIDSRYRGEVRVLLYNGSDTAYGVEAGERIAQLLLQRVEMVSMVEVEALSSAARGDRGFGSTGR